MRIFAKIRWVAVVSMIYMHMISCGFPGGNHSHEGDDTDSWSLTGALSTTAVETVEASTSTSTTEVGTDSSVGSEETLGEATGEDSTTSLSSFRIGGRVDGLAGGSLWLDLNDKENLEITASGPFVFDTDVFDTRSFRVRVLIHPSTPKQQCSIMGGEGVVSGSDVDNIRIHCHVPIRNLVVVLVSGLSGKLVNATTMPNLFSLKDKGVYTWSMQSALPSMSAPNWVALVSGREPQAIGVTGEFPDLPGRDPERVQTIFSKIRRDYPHRKIGAFYQDPKFVRIFPSGEVDTAYLAGEVTEILYQASVWIADASPLLTLVQLTDIKNAGIENGWESSATQSVVNRIDALLGEFVDRLLESHFGQHLGLIIAGDHGGYLSSFGGDHSSERSVPLLVIGPQTEAQPISREVRTWDIAATINDQLQLSTPANPKELGVSVLRKKENDQNDDSVESKLAVRSVHTGDYLRIYSSEQLDASRVMSIWRPSNPPGYAPVGDIVVEGTDEPEFSSLLVRDDPSMVARPLGYELVWNDEGGPSLIQIGLWNPIPPLGYSCLGTVATLNRNVAPSKGEIRCVDSRYLEPTNKRLVWTIQEGSTNWPGGIWRCENTLEQPIFTSTFRIRRFNQEDDAHYPRCFAFDSSRVNIE